MNEHQKTIKKYNDLLDLHGDTPKALGWTKDKEYLRFHILCSGFDLEGSTVLDFGCGLGYLYAYLKENYKNFSYVGVDINENLLMLAKKKFPDADFRCLDLMKDNLDVQPDFILSSGVHNIKLENNEAFNRESFERFSAISKKGFAVNFLSNKVDFPTEGSYHHSPEDILKLAYLYSRRVTLRNDYAPFEFTIFVDHRNSFDSYTVFPEFKKFIRPVESWIV